MTARGLRALACCAWLAASAGLAQSSPVVTSLTLFAGSAEGLWRSRDWGGSWERVKHPALLELGAARAIVATGPQVTAAGEGGLYVSDDFGETWKRVSDLEDIRCLLTSRYPQTDPTLFVGTGEGLQRSDDGGKTFQPTSVAGTPVTQLEWPGPALVAVTGRGVLVSEDAASFDPAGTGLPDAPPRCVALSSFYLVDPVAFAGGERGVYRSSDRARSWRAAGLTDVAVNHLVWLGPVLYAATDDGLRHSSDGGRHWERLGEGLDGRRVRRILFPLAPDSAAEAFVATEDGIFRTPDAGLHWQRAGLQGVAVDVLATFPPPDPPRKKRR